MFIFIALIKAFNYGIVSRQSGLTKQGVRTSQFNLKSMDNSSLDERSSSMDMLLDDISLEHNI